MNKDVKPVILKMYLWMSERFAQYFSGYIIVIARDIKEARGLALKEYEKQFGTFECDDYEDFKRDINETPIEETVLFINGGS